MRSMARIVVRHYDAVSRMLTIEDGSDLLGLGKTAQLPFSAIAALIKRADRDGPPVNLQACAAGSAFRRVISSLSDARSAVRLKTAVVRFGSDDGNCRMPGVMLDVTAAQSIARCVISKIVHGVKNPFTHISAILRMAARDIDQTVAKEASRRASTPWPALMA